MAISAYSKTTYVNGTTPAINATNLNNIEQQVADITSASTADGASPTKIWTSTNDGNGGQPPAPKPRNDSGIGQWIYITGDESDANAPSGGTWSGFGIRFIKSTGVFDAFSATVVPGGGAIVSGAVGKFIAGFAWRIA